MKSSARRRLSAEDRRATILDAAIRSFAAAGFDGTSMDAVAAKAGVTKPVIYDHFPSKAALFMSVLEAVRDDLLARGQVVANSPVDREARLRASIDAFFAFVEDEPAAARVLLVVPRGDPEAAKLSREVQEGASAGIARLLAPALPRREPWRIAVTAEFFKAGLHALAEWRLANPGPSRSDLVDTVMEITRVGMPASGHEAGKL
jgi:AcrR family transcriptional regulator